jgi:catechol 2,3-dioxygenase-like lactoylglutathione lyase family enzyme
MRSGRLQCLTGNTVISPPTAARLTPSDEETLLFDHISIGVRNIAASKKFYDAALKPLGFRCLSESATSLGYGDQSVGLWIGASEHPVPAHPASGLHFCFVAANRRDVDAFHAGALKSGGRDNGAPGLRLDYGPTYYAAFVHDPDGFRIEAHCEKAA